MRNHSIFHKSIAATLALTFSAAQLTYAADVRQMLLDAKSSFIQPEEERRPGVTAQTLTSSQSSVQAEVDQQNALAELQAMNFSLTTANGDILKYVGDTLSEVQRPDGTTLNNITLGSDGKITDANLKLADGSVQVLAGGAVIGYLRSDGTSVQYDASTGRVSRTVSPNGVSATYSYHMAGTTVDISDGSKAEYGTDGVLKKLTKADGVVAEFLSGRISKITKGAAVFTYSQETLADGSQKLTAVTTGTTQSSSTQTTVLPVTVHNQTATSPNPYGPGSAWQYWDIGVGPYHVTYWGGQWLEYQPTLSKDGDLVIEFEARNVGAAVSWFKEFDFAVSLDGVSKGNIKVASDRTNWQKGTVTLKGVAAGKHTVRLTWTNGAWEWNVGSVYLNFRALKMSEQITTTAQTAAALPEGFPKEIIYSKDNVLSQAVMADGTKLVFDKGLLKEATDAAGAKTNFAFAESALGNITQSTLSQNGLDASYDAAGKLSAIKVGELTIHYKKDSAAIGHIEKADGTELWDLAFDAAGAIKDATVYTPDGTERIYKNSALVSMRRPDATEYYFSSGKVSQMITPEKLTYDFTYTQSAIDARLSGTAVPEAMTPVRMVYDASFNLKEVVRKNNEIIQYANSEVNKVLIPDQAEQVYKYVRDAAGKVLSYSVVQGSVETFYDAANQPIRAVISPTAENPNTLEVRYQYGKIRDIKKNGVVTFVYSYAFDAAGRELLKIEDLEEHSVKNYTDGLLMDETDADTSVVSTYSYVDRRVSKVALTRFGRVMHSYAYAYAGADTLVTDEEGTVRRYDAKKKLLTLEREGRKYAYGYSLQNGKEIVEEVLVERRLEDGSLVKYDRGAVSSIELADGTKITDVTLDATRALSRATVTLKDGSKKIINNGELLEEIAADGARWVYSGSKLQQAVSAGGSVLKYRYDANTWVKSGTADLKYDAAGALLGLKLDGIATPAEVKAAAVRKYEGGSNGVYSADGDYNTAMVGASSGSDGSAAADLYSTQTFQTAQTVNSVSFKMSVSSSAFGQYNRQHETRYQVEVLQSGVWNVIGASIGGGGCCEGSHSFDSGKVTLTGLELKNVAAIRAYAHSYGTATGGGSSYSATSAIYELDYTTADQSFYSFSKPNGVPTLTGVNGPLSFNTQGLETLPNADKINAALPAAHSLWKSALADAILAASDVAVQEYSSSGLMETQVKADRTVTLFANNKPSKVLSEQGAVLMEYSYDAAGNISRVHLKNARDTLPDEVLAAEEDIEEQRAATLLELAKQKSLAYGSIKANADTQRALLQGQRGSLESQYAGVASSEARGSAARSAKADALGQIEGSLEQVSSALTTLARQEADAYAALDGQVKAASDKIAADAQAAYKELGKQEAALKKEILRQEVSPVVYDHYRRILGRDPSSAEYEAWIAKVDYDSPVSAPANVLVSTTSAGTQTVLGTTLYNTTSISTKSWDGQTAWFSWEKQWGKDYLVTYWGGQWVDYAPTLTQAGDLKIDYQAINDGKVPAGYPGFQIEFFVDGVSRGVSTVAADQVNWQNATVTLKSLSAGAHTIRLKFMNDAGDANGGDANFKFRNISFTQITAGGTVTTTKALTEALTAELTASPELTERKAYVDAVKKKVSDAVNGHLAKSDAEKKVFAASLGIGEGDSIPLSSADAQKILAWLGSRSLHFGQSAFLSLESLLDQKGISYVREDLAYKAIMTDILSGVITPMDDGDLVISVFALNKVAKGYGVELSAASLNYDDLVKAATKRLVAHVNGNHFVIVTQATADSVTYIDTGIGKDKQNQSLTVSKKDFLKIWKGAVIGEKAVIDPVIASTAAAKPSRILGTEETKRIRGAFLGLIFVAAAGLFSAIGGAVATIAGGIGVFLASVGSAVAGALTAIANGIGTVLAGLGQTLFTGIKFAASTLYNLGSHLFATLTGQTVFSSVSQTAFGGQIFQTAATIGVNYAVTKGMESMGLDPRLANIAGAFAAGGALGAFNSGVFSSSRMIQGAVQGLSIEGARTALQSAGFDSALTSTLSLAAGQFVGGILSGTIGTQIVRIGKDLATNLSFYGVQKVGSALGVDPRISQLAGISVMSTVGSALQPGSTAESIVNGVRDGLVKGVTSVAIESTLQKSGVDALMGSIITLGSAGAVEGLLEGQGLFKGAFDAYFSSSKGLLTLGGPGSTSSDQAVYLSKVIDFSQITQRDGFGAAFSTYASSIFHSQTIENIWKAGGIYDLLAKNAEVVVNAQGETVKRVYTNKNDKLHSEYIDISLSTDELVGYKEVLVDVVIVTDCVYQVGPDGKVQAKDEIKTLTYPDGRSEVYTVMDHRLVSIKKLDANGAIREIITQIDSSSIKINNAGEVIHGIRKNIQEGVVTKYRDGKVEKLEIESRYVPTEIEYRMLLAMSFTESQISGITRQFVYDASGNSPTQSSKLYMTDGAWVDLKGEQSVQWLQAVKNSTAEIWETAVKMISDGTVSTTSQVDRTRGVANVDMSLTYPDTIKPDKVIQYQALTLAQYLARSNSNWHTEVINAAPTVGAILANKDASFVFMAGVNSSGRTLDELAAMKASLDTSKSVVVGHSAGTELAMRSAFVQKADKYIIASPRMSPDQLKSMMDEARVKSSQVIIVSTVGDFWNWGPSFVGTNSEYGWTSINISDGPGVTGAGVLSAHGASIDGWVSNQLFTVSINGTNGFSTTLSDAYKQAVNS